MARYSVQNRVALRKALRSFSADDLKRISTKSYKKNMRTLTNKARQNAPTKSGNLKRSINQVIRTKRGARSGVILRGYVYAHRLYDAMQHNPVPKGRGLTSTEARKLSRTWNGKRHTVRTGQDYSSARTKTPTGRKAKNPRKWAWGERPQGVDKTRYMTRGQQFEEVNVKIAKEIGRDILQEFSKAFNRQVTVGGKR